MAGLAVACKPQSSQLTVAELRDAYLPHSRAMKASLLFSVDAN